MNISAADCIKIHISLIVGECLSSSRGHLDDFDYEMTRSAAFASVSLLVYDNLHHPEIVYRAFVSH